MSLIVFDELDSTNSYAKRNIEVLRHLDIIFTKIQTAGRGRTSHSWSSTSESLTFSVVFKDDFIYEHFDSVSLINAVSVYEALSEYVDDIMIKWPNDLLIHDKKLVGILMESVCYEKIEGMVLGIGVNVNNRTFPEEVKDTATSLFLETGKTFSIEKVRDSIIRHLKENLEKLKKGDTSYLDIMNSRNYLFGKKAYATIGDRREFVTVGKILPDNHLKVETEKGVFEVSTDEISFHK